MFCVQPQLLCSTSAVVNKITFFLHDEPSTDQDGDGIVDGVVDFDAPTCETQQMSYLNVCADNACRAESAAFFLRKD